MRYMILERQSTILMYDDDSINPASSLQVMRVGDRAMIHTLAGPGFYALLKHCGLQPFVDMGLASVYAAVSDAHLKLMHRQLRTLRITHEGDCHFKGMRLNWVLLEPAVAGVAPEATEPNPRSG